MKLNLFFGGLLLLATVSLSPAICLSSDTDPLTVLIERADSCQNNGLFGDALDGFVKAKSVCAKTDGEVSQRMQYIYGSIAACAMELNDYDLFAQSLEKLDHISQKIGFDKDMNEPFICIELAKYHIYMATDSAGVAKASPYLDRCRKISISGNDRDLMNLCDFISHRANYTAASFFPDLNNAAPVLEREYKYFISCDQFPIADTAEDIISCGLLWSGNLMDRTLNEECLGVLDEIERTVPDIDSHPRYLELKSGRLYALSNLIRPNDCLEQGLPLLTKFPENEDNFQLICAIRYNLGRAYSQLEKSQDALDMFNSIYSSPFSHQLTGTDTDFIKAEIANCYLNLDRIPEAKSLCEEILQRKPSGYTKVQTSWILGEIANRNNDRRELNYIEEFVKAYETLGHEDLSYADSFLWHSKQYQNFYQYSKALDLINRSIEMYERRNATNEINYYIALARKASLCAYSEDFDGYTSSMTKLNNAASFIKEIISNANDEEKLDNLSELIENMYEAVYVAFSIACNEFNESLAKGNLSAGEIGKARDTLKYMQSQILQFTDLNKDLVAWLKTNNPNRLGMIYDYAALTYRDLGEYDAEIDFINRSMTEIDPACEMYGVLGELKNLAVIASSDFTQMETFIKEKFESDKKYLNSMLNSFTHEHRGEMWKLFYNNISNYVGYAIKGNLPWLNEIAYDAILLSKGLLLQSDNDFISRISHSGDATLQERFNSYLTLAKDNKTEEAAAIEREIIGLLDDKFESNLIKHTWKDIRDKLGDNDYAVEFRGYMEDGQTTYVAFTLDNKCDSPLLVELCSEDDLDGAFENGNLNYERMSELVWSHLYSIIPKGARVFFSPDFKLHSIPLESLPVENNGKMLANEYWHMFRLSSTRELLGNAEKIGPESSSSIFGGFSYSMNADKLLADFKELESSRERSLDEIPTIDIRGAVTTIRELPGSKKEVAAISALMSDNNISHRCFSGEDGSESVFKLNAGKDNILHISTHGFFFADSNQGNKNRIMRIISGNRDDFFSKSESMLHRSGLMMAGVNEILMGRTSASVCDDGILTAKEISQMDLSQTRLAVLSACETGLGLTTGDGVFGLQRGFKIAGVKSILMSLWKVDDSATELLMVEFYRNWLGGAGLHNSLISAQNSVRNTPGWEHPRFWAGFILLDCID